MHKDDCPQKQKIHACAVKNVGIWSYCKQAKFKHKKKSLLFDLPFFSCPNAAVGNYFVISWGVSMIKGREHKECEGSHKEELHSWFLNSPLAQSKRNTVLTGVYIAQVSPSSLGGWLDFWHAWATQTSPNAIFLLFGTKHFSLWSTNYYL